MTEELDEVATELVDKAEIRDGQAIVTYSRTEAALADLRAKYQGAKYDLTTTAGNQAARAGRLALVTLRGDLEKKRQELKAPALEFGRQIDSEAARIKAEILALEQPIDAQIKADELRRETERKAKEAAEAARKKVHTDAIAKIAGYVGQATDLGSERLAKGIALLEGMDLTGFEEYQTEATQTRDRTLAALQALHIKAVAREAEEARLAAQAAEQARIAAEQAEVARRLKAQEDEIARQRAELEAAERAAAERRAAEEARRQREADEARQQAEEAAQAAQEAQEAAQRAAAAPSPTPAPAEALPAAIGGSLARPQPDDGGRFGGPAGAPVSYAPLTTAQASVDGRVVPMPTRAPAATVPSGPPTLSLGAINKRLAAGGVDPKLSADFLAAIGVPHAGTDRAAKLWHEHQLPAICLALARHFHALADQQEAA